MTDILYSIKEFISCASTIGIFYYAITIINWFCFRNNYNEGVPYAHFLAALMPKSSDKEYSYTGLRKRVIKLVICLVVSTLFR